jgi:hypothetical protein
MKHRPHVPIGVIFQDCTKPFPDHQVIIGYERAKYGLVRLLRLLQTVYRRLHRIELSYGDEH